ncbi:hypothetical protein B7494_g6490 [Chlorociboria aeruginascens]|nr:hypothetical protein B7494_g6490 [Chlorociboria aeruginascens]
MTMAARRSIAVQPDYGYERSVPSGTTNPPISSVYGGVSRAGYDKSYYTTSRQERSGPYIADVSPTSYSPIASTASVYRPDPLYSSTRYNTGSPTAAYGNKTPSYDSYANQAPSWESKGRISPETYADDYVTQSPTDYALESSSRSTGKSKSDGKSHSQRRPSNRDEFDGPHQFLKRPSPEYIAQQERDLPHLPTNLVVQEQDSVLTQVNDRLSLCAFDFVAKYQFPIPCTESQRPVEQPQDREWTEWVYLLKRLATKRRIPARVLYQGQIKQFITVLENSLEMRHAAKHQSRPLKDDRNILQLISAGIQVARLLRDSRIMSQLDQLYVATENTIRERSVANRCRS